VTSAFYPKPGQETSTDSKSYIALQLLHHLYEVLFHNSEKMINSMKNVLVLYSVVTFPPSWDIIYGGMKSAAMGKKWIVHVRICKCRKS